MNHALSKALMSSVVCFPINSFDSQAGLDAICSPYPGATVTHTSVHSHISPRFAHVWFLLKSYGRVSPSEKVGLIIITIPCTLAHQMTHLSVPVKYSRYFSVKESGRRKRRKEKMQKHLRYVRRGCKQNKDMSFFLIFQLTVVNWPTVVIMLKGIMAWFCLISESIVKCYHKPNTIHAALNYLPLIICMFIMLSVLVYQVRMLAFANWHETQSTAKTYSAATHSFITLCQKSPGNHK